MVVHSFHVSDKLVAHAVTADVLTTPCRAHLLLSLPLPVTMCVYHHSLAFPGSWFPFNGLTFSSSGFFIGTAALMTQALKSSCPGFGAFSVDIRYRCTSESLGSTGNLSLLLERVTALGAWSNMGFKLGL